VLNYSPISGICSFTMREISVVFDPERKLVLYFGLLAAVVGVGPFGTYQAMSFWQRLAFWSLDILGGMLIILPIVHVFFHARFARALPDLPRLFAGVTLGSVPAAAYIAWLNRELAGGPEIGEQMPILLIEVPLFTTALLLVEFVLWPRLFGTADPGAGAATSAAPAVPSPSVSRLRERLPAELRDAPVISISMQDHYAQIVTSAGEHLLLIRLGDAIDLLDGTPGAQVHRSHWAAAAYATRLRRDGRRHELLLDDGRALPVSAKYLDDARALVETKNGA
jgi:hypothetical protein